MFAFQHRHSSSQRSAGSVGSSSLRSSPQHLRRPHSESQTRTHSERSNSIMSLRSSTRESNARRVNVGRCTSASHSTTQSLNTRGSLLSSSWQSITGNNNHNNHNNSNNNSNYSNKRKTPSNTSASTKNNVTTAPDLCHRRRAQSPVAPEQKSFGLPRDELLHLLCGKMRLADICPNAYRLNLDHEEDLHYLYKLRHRVDPELTRPTRAVSPWTRAHMHTSHVFDAITKPPPVGGGTPERPPRARSAMSAVALFALGGAPPTDTGTNNTNNTTNTGTNTVSPRRGRRVPDFTVATADCCPSPRATGRAHVSGPADHIAMDLTAAGCAPLPRGRRTMKAVEAFEAARPVAPRPLRPERKVLHAAASDSDIFGVRQRRYALQERSSEPFGSESVSGGHTKAIAAIAEEGKRGTARRTAPFGHEEIIMESGAVTPTRRHGEGSAYQREHRTQTQSIAGSVAASNTIPQGLFMHNQKGASRSFVAPEAPYSSRGSLLSGRSSTAESFHSGPLVHSPRRSGCARVPGRSVTHSQIVFGDAPHIQPSPQRTRRSNSSRMRSILMWE